MSALRILPLALLLSACIPEAPPREEKPIVYADHNKDVDGAKVQAEHQADLEAAAEAARDPEAGPDIKSLEIGPDEPRASEAFWAKATLSAGASAFTDIEYTWYVNGSEVLGVTKDRLTPEKGRYVKKDRVHVSVTALDEKGKMATLTSDEIQIANATPTITRDLSKAAGLDGIRLKAEDPDGDRLTWSIVEGPAGITIDQRGLIRVSAMNLSEDFAGEVVVAAEDEDGARAELHVPVTINASREGRVDEEVKTQHFTDKQMDDEQLARAQEAAMERLEKMSPEEYDKWSAEQEKKNP